MIILIILLIAAIIFFIITSINLLSDVQRIKNQISFEDFKKYYSLEPGHWTLKDHYVRFSEKKNDPWHYDTEFRFNLIDTWRYSWFNAGIEAKEEMEREAEEKAFRDTAYSRMKSIMDKYNEEET